MNQIKNLPNPSLTFCIIMDLIGYASFAVPVLAEISDIIWAPLSAMIFMKSFGGRVGRLGSVFNFIEEILPFTDFIPSFSIAWLVRNGVTGKSSNNIVVPALQQ